MKLKPTLLVLLSVFVSIAFFLVGLNWEAVTFMVLALLAWLLQKAGQYIEDYPEEL